MTFLVVSWFIYDNNYFVFRFIVKIYFVVKNSQHFNIHTRHDYLTQVFISWIIKYSKAKFRKFFFLSVCKNLNLDEIEFKLTIPYKIILAFCNLKNINYNNILLVLKCSFFMMIYHNENLKIFRLIWNDTCILYMHFNKQA